MPTTTFQAHTEWTGSVSWLGPVGFLAESAWSGAVSMEPTIPSTGTMFVLARRSEFLPATGTPTQWRPAETYGYGVATLSRELGLGEMVSYARVKTAEWAGVKNSCGVNLFGGTEDELEVVDAVVVVSLMGDDEPDTGDLLSVEDGREFTVVSWRVENARGQERAATLRMVRMKGVTRSKVRPAHFAVSLVS